MNNVIKLDGYPNMNYNNYGGRVGVFVIEYKGRSFIS